MPSPISHVGVESSSVPANASTPFQPVANVWGKVAEQVGLLNASIVVDFTVPNGSWTVLYLWAIGGGLASYQAPNLPAGLNITAEIPSLSAGAAEGNLTPGNYSTDLFYAGWTNTVSVVIYGIPRTVGLTYQYAEVSEPNPHPQNSSVEVNLTLPSGGLEYLGAEDTGGYAITNWSMPYLDAATDAWNMAGYTEIIGAQSNGTISGMTAGAGLGLMEVGIYGSASALVPIVLASLSEAIGGLGDSFPLTFTVPGDVSEVLYLWSIGGGLASYQLPTLPAGLEVVSAVPAWDAGVAAGQLNPGNYTTDLSYAGWTNTVSIVVYGIFGHVGALYRFASLAEPNLLPGNQTMQLNLTLPAGGFEYFGAEVTGGYAITDWSMPVLDAATPAWGMFGSSEPIGRQFTNVLSGFTAGAGLGLVGVGIYTSISTVSFDETGLPPGTQWQMAVDGVEATTIASSSVWAVPRGTISYLIVRPAGYQVTGISPSGTVVAQGSGSTVSFSFAKGKTLSLQVKAKGLPTGWPWCFTIAGLETCTYSTSQRYLDLTPGVYAYALMGFTGVELQARAGTQVLPMQGTLTLDHGTTVTLSYLARYTVTFNETGLTTGTWSITIHGVTVVEPAGVPIVFYLPNGDYRYKIGVEAGYVRGGVPSSVVVRNAPAIVQVVFVREP